MRVFDGGALFCWYLPGQEAGGQRRVGEDAEPGGPAGRDDLPFDLPGEQTVARLQRHRAGEPAQFRDVHGLLDLPG
jgi:hypothetical protein